MDCRSGALRLFVVLLATGLSAVAMADPPAGEPVDPWRAGTPPDSLQIRDIRRDDIVEPWGIVPLPGWVAAESYVAPDELVDPWHGDPLRHRAGALPDPWGDEAAPEPANDSGPPVARFEVVDFTDGPGESASARELPHTASRAAFPLLE